MGGYPQHQSNHNVYGSNHSPGAPPGHGMSGGAPYGGSNQVPGGAQPGGLQSNIGGQGAHSMPVYGS